MKFHSFLLLSVSVLVPASAQDPAPSQPFRIPVSAVIESIDFENVTPANQKLVLDRIGVRAGDELTVEVRHRIGGEIGKVQKGMTFTYKAGSKWGAVKLIIQGDC